MNKHNSFKITTISIISLFERWFLAFGCVYLAQASMQNSQAECLGLFVEAEPKDAEPMVATVLQALAQLCREAKEMPWQATGDGAMFFPCNFLVWIQEK